MTRLHEDVPVSPGNFDAEFRAKQLPEARDQFVSILGTAWAVRAILQAVPVAAVAKAAPVPAPAVTPAGLPPVGGHGPDRDGRGPRGGAHEGE